MGRRYLIDYDVSLRYLAAGKSVACPVKGIDISTTGMLLEVPPEVGQDLRQAEKISLKFVIAPGTMPEGYEMKVRMAAKFIRLSESPDGKTRCGVEFAQSLAQYAARRKSRYLLPAAAFLLFVITACILLLRAESVLYFKFNQTLYLYSIIAATFLLTRYLFASFYRPVPIDKDFTPGVSIIVPCFNEETWIQKTIAGCLNQDYPSDKLEVIIVDDHSDDQSVARIKEIVEKLKTQEPYYRVGDRLHYLCQEKNAGKREALARGTLMARHELVVFVDSDSFLEPFAIRNVVQPFKDAKTGGVTGRTDVANTYTNALTKMQAVRYFIAFRIMKAAESYFDAVTCLSGPLSCYRKALVVRHLDSWLQQTFLGEKATFGDDRSMTNFILRGNRTVYQDTAVCHTIVPNTYRVFLKQQMRWKRSWLRESLIAAGFMWRKEPFMALSFYAGLLIPVLAPVTVVYNLVYIPLVHRVFPLTFAAGLLLMAMLMSMAQLLLRKSSTWIFGLWFCLYYEAVLLWQMPVAWVTFWKTTWGTRMTPADIMERLKKNRRQQKKA
ncbi:glycosyltransferase family 2 protein [Acetonema longum]|uniref:Glycosyl transferase family protein n=1 Tax=Acetonema longum DSM 6540 TaxID=1009370 RepID=F7NJS9_9FIRM|nr:glycosyl transferase family protein [Acetonema longum DSM 6540]